MIKLDEIKNKTRTRYGVKYEGNVIKGHKAEIAPGQYVRLYGQEWNHINAPVDFDKTFKIGDEAEYDSYNLKYTGKIISIGPGTVTIEAYPDSNLSKKYRLNIYTFSWRNWDFNSKKTAEYNSEEMMCI